MKNIIIFATSIALLAGCTSAPKGYGPAYGSDFGYRNTQIEQDRFRISYTSRDTYESRDLALLRAAQIAENEGYTHFKILSGDHASNGPNAISSRIGVGFGGRYNRGSHIGVGVNDVARALEGQKVTETIEVRLLPIAQPNNPNVYSAQSVIKNIVPPIKAASTP